MLRLNTEVDHFYWLGEFMRIFLTLDFRYCHLLNKILMQYTISKHKNVCLFGLSELPNGVSVGGWMNCVFLCYPVMNWQPVQDVR